MSTAALRNAIVKQDQQDQPTTESLMKTQVKDAGMGKVKSFFESQKGMLMSLLPKHVSPDRMLRLAMGAVRQNPKLLDCTVESLFGGIVLCSQLGLEPNTPLGHCYLIPFTVSRRIGNTSRYEKVTEVQFIAGYKGLIDLARRSGQIESISSRVVYSNDEFELQYGTVDSIKHIPCLENRGDIIGYYAVAKMKDGGKQFEFMSQAEVDEVRDASQNAWKDEYEGGVKTGKKTKQASSPWWKNPSEMGRKTVIRRLFKYLPTSIEMANTIALDEKSDYSDNQKLDDVLTGEYQVMSYEQESTSSHADHTENYYKIVDLINDAKDQASIDSIVRAAMVSGLPKEEMDLIRELALSKTNG